MNDINEEIRLAFDAMSLLLVFVTVLFDIRYKVIQKEIEKSIPEGDKAKKQLRRELIRGILINSAPLVVITGGISYLFSPLLRKVIEQSKLNIWNFDFFSSSFVFIVLLIFLFFLWSCYLTILLLIRIYKTGKK